MAWIQIKAYTNETNSELIGDQLQLLGAEAITYQDAGDTPIYEPPPGAILYWQHTTVTALFSENANYYPAQEWLKTQEKQQIIEHFTVDLLTDCDWERECLKDIKSIQIGQRLWVCPTWETPPDSNACNLILDPGLAFGTGTHPTTALCLAWLEKNIIGDEQVIDYGCGSGILGLAALKLGSKHVTAIDFDPQALLATEKNLQRNNLPASKVTLCLPDDLAKNQPPVDILLANILSKPLIELAPNFNNLIKKGGKLVLSGILQHQAYDVQQAYQAWFDFDQIKQQAEWVCLSATKK